MCCTWSGPWGKNLVTLVGPEYREDYSMIQADGIHLTNIKNSLPATRFQMIPDTIKVLLRLHAPG